MLVRVKMRAEFRVKIRAEFRAELRSEQSLGQRNCRVWLSGTLFKCATTVFSIPSYQLDKTGHLE